MYRPNRIGPWPLLDLDRVLATWPVDWNTNFNAADSGLTDVKPHMELATVRDDYDQVCWKRDDVQLVATQSMTFGVCISGEAPNNKPVMLTVAGGLSLAAATVINAEASFGIGRLDSSSVDVTRNAANNNISVPHVLRGAGDTEGFLNLDYIGQVGVIDLAADGFGSNPICFFCRMRNLDAAAGWDWLDFSLSLHISRYVSDVDMFDPNR